MKKAAAVHTIRAVSSRFLRPASSSLSTRTLHCSSSSLSSPSSSSPSSTHVSSSSSSPSSHTSKYTYSSNPNAVATTSTRSSTRGGISLANLTKPGGRSSVSGIVATVFGATGFVGNYVVSNLGRIGSQVIVPYRGDGMNTRHLKLAGDLGQIVPIPCELSDEDAVRRAVAKSNVVVNTLGSQFETANYTFHDTHVKCAYRIAKIAKEAGVERFIHVSALGADINSTSSFYRSKAEGELTIQQFFPDATILRPAVIYGDEDRFLNYIAAIGSRFIALPLVNHGRQKLQPVYVIDVARAVLGAIQYEEAIGQTYELGGPDIYTYANVIRLVNHSAFLNVRGLHLPDPIARIYGKILGGAIFHAPEDAKPLVKALYAVASHLRLNGIFYEDRVAQAYVDLVCDPSAPGLVELGVTPTNLLSVIDNILLARRPDGVAPDRFPDAERIKEQAKPAGYTDTARG